jgi:hypothetical protein
MLEMVDFGVSASTVRVGVRHAFLGMPLRSMSMSTHEDRRAEKRPLRWMKLFIWVLVIGGAALVVNWMRAPAGDASTPMGKEPAQHVVPAKQ